jgi:hypothetical protein
MSGIRFEINETSAGVVAPPKDVCKVKDCGRTRFQKKGGHAFCKHHSGLKNQMSREKFKDLKGNNEWAIAPEQSKRKGLPTQVVRDGKTVTIYVTSKRKKWKVIKDKLLGKS